MKFLTFSCPMLLLFLVFGAQAYITRGYVTNPGTVVDANNKPVKNAYISYMSLDKRYTWSYSDATGAFGAPVAIRNQKPATIAGGLQVSFIKGQLSFYVSQGARAKVELFDLAGRSLGTVLDRTMDQRGYFSFSPFATSKKAMGAHGISGKGFN